MFLLNIFAPFFLEGFDIRSLQSTQMLDLEENSALQSQKCKYKAKYDFLTCVLPYKDDYTADTVFQKSTIFRNYKN